MKYLKKYKYHITILLIITIGIYIFYIKQNLIKNNDANIKIDNELLKSETKSDISDSCNVDIKGAVLNPGVYLVECSKNVSDVINIAGGTKEEADTSLINLAKRISDEMVIIIYTKDEVLTMKESNKPITIEKECVCPEIKNDACINEESKSLNSTLVNINTATKEELKTIPGIGESKADAIIKYRGEHGNFKDIEDIKNVTGIGEKLYEEIKVYITK